MNWIKNIKIKNIFLGILKYYGYISTFLVGFITFWFGVDPLKTSNNVYIKPVTDFLNDHIFGLTAFSSIGLLLKILRDKSYEKELKELKSENEKLKTDLINLSEALKDLSKDILRDFSIEKLDGKIGEKMRITLYIKNKENKLYCLGRYSENIDFAEFSESRIYQDEKGIIIKSWKEGNNNELGLFDNDFPDPNTKNGLKNYIQYQKNNYGFDKDEVKNMKMKSRLYYSYRVEYHGENLGVILIESLSNNKYSKDVLDGIIKDLEGRILIVLNSTFKYLDAPKIYSSNQI